jgi:hypothetical protein
MSTIEEQELLLKAQSWWKSKIWGTTPVRSKLVLMRIRNLTFKAYLYRSIIVI